MIADVAALQHALTHLRDPSDPGAGYVHAPPLTAAQQGYCSAPFPVVVPLDASLRRKRIVSFVVKSANGAAPSRANVSRLKLTCEPSGS